MTEVAAREGYAEASIAAAIAQARVSRSTFYEHFKDKEACFLAAQEELGRRLLARVQRAASTCEPRRATHAALGELVAFTEDDRAGAQLLMNESLGAGRRAMDRRDGLLARVAGAIERAWDETPAGEPAPDVPAAALVGGACRLIAIRIPRGIGSLHGLAPDLRAWADSYARVSGAPRRRTLTPISGAAPRSRSPHAETAAPPEPPPGPLPPGRHGLSAAYVSRNQRERILHATTEMLLRKGYAATTVADVVAAAHLTRAVFYGHFHDKREVFLELQQLHFQRIMAVSARAFFSAPTWPERVWEGICAAADLIGGDPALAHVGFLESHTAGPASVRHANDAMMAFAVFLEEGYRCRPEAGRLPQLCSEAIAAALYETLYLATRRGGTHELSSLVPDIAYCALAPFMGAEQAGEFVEGKLDET